MAKTDETHTRGGTPTRKRSAQYATNRRRDGLTKVCVWVPEESRERIIELAAQMRAELVKRRRQARGFQGPWGRLGRLLRHLEYPRVP